MTTRHTKKHAVKGPMTSQNIGALISPIITFLHKSGISKKRVLAECRAAIHNAESTTFKIPVIHVEFGKDGIDIVNRWLRDPKYLNRHGRPEELPLVGPRSVTSLVKDCRVAVTPAEALPYLLKFKIVTRVASGKYRLISRSMVFWHEDYLPFEPNFKFLVDATRAATNRLQRPKDGLFWQCADNPRIHPRLTNEFLSFVKRRGLSFMHEINDWLDEHEIKETATKSRTIRTKRMGVGLLSIVSDS